VPFAPPLKTLSVILGRGFVVGMPFPFASTPPTVVDAITWRHVLKDTGKTRGRHAPQILHGIKTQLISVLAMYCGLRR
jgi:hypothetical protein